MKSVFKKLLLVAAFLGAAVLTQGQFVAQGDDQYIGAEPNKPYWVGSDVMGTFETYSLTNWSVSLDQVSDTLTVQVFGSYFDAFMATPSQTSTALGDLFISTDGLNWDTTPETLTDQFGSTSWEYAVQLGTYYNTNNAIGAYDVNSPAAGDVVAISDPGTQIKLSDEFFPPPYDTQAFRQNQEVQVKNMTEQDLVGGATWFVDTDEDMISISIADFTQIFGEDAFGNLGFHFTMSCANDVVEFAVPEPSTVGILAALGLMGVLYARRRITKG
jgi:hypothetical protein